MVDKDFPPRPDCEEVGINQDEIEWLQAVIDARRTRVERTSGSPIPERRQE